MVLLADGPTGGDGSDGHGVDVLHVWMVTGVLVFVVGVGLLLRRRFRVRGCHAGITRHVLAAAQRGDAGDDQQAQQMEEALPLRHLVPEQVHDFSDCSWRVLPSKYDANHHIL